MPPDPPAGWTLHAAVTAPPGRRETARLPWTGMDATETADALAEPVAVAPEWDEDGDAPTPWYAPGLYRRVQERRRLRKQRPRRRTLREVLRDRGLHWSSEVVVGLFVAVVVASLATIALSRVGSGQLNDLVPSHRQVSGASGGSASGADGESGSPTATPLCAPAPIPGQMLRPCVH